MVYRIIAITNRIIVKIKFSTNIFCLENASMIQTTRRSSLWIEVMSNVVFCILMPHADPFRDIIIYYTG